MSHPVPSIDLVEDEFLPEDFDYEEEEAGESVLRNERDIVLSEMNRGIEYVNITKEQLI